jgi:hypothetical protein
MYKKIFFGYFPMCVLYVQDSGWKREDQNSLTSVQSIIYYVQTFQMMLLLNKYCLDFKQYVNLIPRYLPLETLI